MHGFYLSLYDCPKVGQVAAVNLTGDHIYFKLYVNILN